jgi:hypothetical protein
VELTLERRAYYYKQPPLDPQTPSASFSPYKALLASLSPYPPPSEKIGYLCKPLDISRESQLA